MSTRRTLAAASVMLAVAGCRAAERSSPFPRADRDVSPIVSDRFSTENARDRVGEAEAVTSLAGIKPGMRVADIGAGEGYYTVRLAPLVGGKGRVLAEDIVADTRDQLAQRVQREGLDNVSVRLGLPDDPRLPSRSFDRVFLVHMYHEVTSPYAFLWNLRDGLKPDGEVIVVDADRPTRHHGIPPSLLACEFAAVGLARTKFAMLEGSDAYFASFAPVGPRPEPAAIKACKAR